MPIWDPDNPGAHHEEAVRVARKTRAKEILYRCRHCEKWHTLRPTGWKSQHVCDSCGKLSYLYPWHREEAAKLKGGDPDVPNRPVPSPRSS